MLGLEIFEEDRIEAQAILDAMGSAASRRTAHDCRFLLVDSIDSIQLQRIFDLHEHACQGGVPAHAVPLKPGSEAEVKDKVIEAHRVLMGLNPENKARFTDLLAALERD